MNGKLPMRVAIVFGVVNVLLAAWQTNVQAALGWGLATFWMADGLRRFG